MQKNPSVTVGTHVNNLPQTIFLILGCRSTIRYHSTLFGTQILIFQHDQGALSEEKGVLNCELYDYEESFDEITLDAPLSERFFTRRMKKLSQPDGFMLYVKKRVDFLSTSEMP